MYNHKKIEKKWSTRWKKERLFELSDKYIPTKRSKAMYILDMFPYPSGAGLHVGHPMGYIASDVLSRYYRAQGKTVLHPMGWDAFGLPAENYAIKNKIHPKVVVKQNVARFKKQIDRIGFSYDWSREINTTEPQYYKWTQWIFLKLFEHGLAYKKETPVNWCPSCKTVLADEEAEGGVCDRCSTKVERKNIEQWMLKITAYAERLLTDLDTIQWPEKVKRMQRNWIGKSAGALIDFDIHAAPHFPLSTFHFPHIRVFTTRPDTLFGATYLVIAPEHQLIKELGDTIKNNKEVAAYVRVAINKSDQERITEGKNKTGVRLEGITAVNPANKKEIPIFVADYVLPHYGTGAIMAVPAHDSRDFDFAKKYNLPIVQVINSGQKEKELPYEGDGALINSGEFDGKRVTQAAKEIVKKVKGTFKTTYRLRDWIFSRQRYWGEPFPVVFCQHCKKEIESLLAKHKIPKDISSSWSSVVSSKFSLGELLNPGWISLKEKDLPLTLPKVKKYEPTGTLNSPLAVISSWVNTRCPRCGGKAQRETNTMPQWAGSCWYYLRYIDPRNKKELVNTKKAKSFLPVDIYIGGVEHAVLHLLYARFWHKFLYDIKAVPTAEPFYQLKNQGLILGPDGEKMSKSRGNVINPDDIIDRYGADALRLYEMFMGPFEDAKPWSTDGIVGLARFLERVWNIYEKKPKKSASTVRNKKLERVMHYTIKKVGEDIKNVHFNTAVSALMIASKEIDATHDVPQWVYDSFIVLCAPFAPFIAEEIWRVMLGHKHSITKEKWPTFNARMLVRDEVVIAVQINGKTKGTVTVDQGSEKETVIGALKKDKKLVAHIENKIILKTIFVPDRVINLVIKQ